MEKTNRFHICRHAIAYLGDAHDCDIGAAALDFANRMGWEVGADTETGYIAPYNAEYEEFLTHVRALQQTVKPGVGENAVKRYFYEE